MPEEEQQQTVRQLAMHLPEDTSRFNLLPAGGDEEESSQGYRLGQIKQHLQKQVPNFLDLVRQTELGQQTWCEKNYQALFPLFKAIKEGRPTQAIRCFQKLLKDPVIRLLLSVHSQAYLEYLIQACAKASRDKPSCLYPKDEDCLIKRDTFELLLMDLVRTVGSVSTINLSFNLPTHHAYYDKGNGFCLLNKTAAMIYYLCNGTDTKKPMPFILGLDINRDDGLNDILCRDKDLPFVHIDVCDPRVYPYHSIEDIKSKLGNIGFTWEQNGAVHVFSRDQQSYHLVDLSAYTKRGDDSLHPALEYIKMQLGQLLSSHSSIAIFAPTGYDACDLEPAPCANYFAKTEEEMDSSAKQYQRLTMDDYRSMMDWLMQQTVSSDLIRNFYYSLEGGYTSQVYAPLVVDMVKKANDYSARTKTDHYLVNEKKPSSCI